ncbi:ribosome maturation factor RimM [Suttonella ornithocola]|uniref:Ribosome maturation factor RimM n=1 Tax=Suttonella ornithocola TaxID=279832 RepID=A0A380MQE9_9GAMM|nr:ribosome maturation factor RimM [Suttonella ornithocola]SUO94839.1 Ribosome maturation factor rimM [Suttonella ornithocola]
MKSNDAQVYLGRIVGVHGVRGWVKIHSDCRPREAILRYKKFLAKNTHQPTFSLVLKNGQKQNKSLIAQFEDINDRDAAMALMGTSLYVLRSEMPDLPEGEIYWADLLGLKVMNREDTFLGEIKEILETGANDVLIVKSDTQEHLIPYAIGTYIDEYDPETGTLYVDWDPKWSDISNE